MKKEKIKTEWDSLTEKEKQEAKRIYTEVLKKLKGK